MNESTAFANARAVLAQRGSARSSGGQAMRVYLALFIVLIIVIPVTRALVLALASQPSVALLTAAETPAAILAGSLALVFVVACMGGWRGAVVPRPAYVNLVVRSALAQRLTLRRPLVAAHALVAGACAVAAAVTLAALGVAGYALNPGAVALCLAMAAAYGALLVTAWLAGQASSGVRRVASLTLAAGFVAGIAAFLFGGGTSVAAFARNLAAIVASASVPTVAGGLTVLIGLTAWLVAASLALLTRLRSTDLMTQGQAWSSAGILAITGDVRGSLESVRMPARHTPRRAGLLRGRIWLLVVKRDAVGAVRHPVRLAAGCAGGIAAGVLITAALAAEPGTAAFIAAAAGAIGYLSAGALTDGVRAHADNIGAPVLFGAGPGAMTVMHLAFAAAVSCALMTAGAALAYWLWQITAPTSLAGAGLLALTLIALRGTSAVKGPLPITLLLPVPTPVGDVSILFAMAWAFDAVLIALLLGFGVLWAGGAMAMALWSLAVLLTLTAWGWVRLRRLRA